MKKILLFSFHAQPDNNGATQRIKNIFNMLPEYGIEVILVTKKINSCKKEANIVRYQHLNRRNTPIRWVLYKSYQCLRRKKGQPYDFWVNKVIKNLPNLIKMYKPDYCMVSYPPFEMIQIGLELLKLNQKLLVDFRDGLMYESIEKKRLENSSFFEKCKQFEKEIIEKASYVFTSVQPLSDYFTATYGNFNIETIQNGFNDEEIFHGVPIILPKNKLKNIVYTGSLDRSRLGLFDIFRKFYSTKKINANFIFVGDYFNYEINYFKNHENIYFFSKQSRDIIVLTQRKADFLLLITGFNEKSATGGKLYEYLFSGKPIINIGNNNNACRIIQETHTGVSFSENDYNLFNEYISGTPPYCPIGINIYTRRYQIEKMASIINDNL